MLFFVKRGNSFKIDKPFHFKGIPIISQVRGSNIQFGSNVHLVSRSRNTALGVNHECIIRALSTNANIEIGNNFRASGVTICCANKITIGNNVMVGGNSIITDTDFHSLNINERFTNDDVVFAKNSPVMIGNDVFIGMNVIILKGVTIGNNAVIASASVITKDVPPSTIVAGNPGKIIKLI
jgi:acetyltransferase-like isoleucine patch superfamily enzyme